MYATTELSRRSVSVIASAALALTGLRAAADGNNQADAFPTFDSYIKVTGQAASITGDGAAFQKVTQQPQSGAWGLEDLHYEKDVTKDVTFDIDGRALSGLEDYLAHFNVTKTDVGSIDAGYKSFRTFYDGIGGFFPTNQAFALLSPEALHVDRGTFWVNAKLEMPDRPVFTLSYRNETRTGQKDSTIWGDSNMIGLPTTPANNADRKINPDVETLNEHHQVVEGTMQYKIGRTTATLTVTGDWVSNDDVRNWDLYLGQTLPNPQAVLLDEQVVKSHSFGAMLKTETEFNEKVALETGWRFQDLSSNLAGGQRLTNIGLTAAANVANLAGGATYDLYTGNAFLKFTPTKAWLIDAGVKLSGNDTTAGTNWVAVAQATAGATTTVTDTYDAGHSRVKATVATPAISFNYSGLNRIDLFGSFEDGNSRGDQHWINPYAFTPATGLSGAYVPSSAPAAAVIKLASAASAATLASDTFTQAANQDSRNATLGFNWKPGTGLTLRVELFDKDHQNKFVGYGTNLGNLYVLGYQFTGAKISVIYKPVAELSFNTRYQPQTGRMQVTYSGAGTDFTSGRARAQTISETINWTPVQQFYAQANANVCYSTVQTAYPYVGGVGATHLHNADNNYVSGSALCGFTVSKTADLQLEGTFLRADDYDPSFAAPTTTTGGLPYGAGFTESTCTVAYKLCLSKTWIATIKAGYMRGTSEMTGGNTDYHGPLAYVGLEHAL